MRLAQDADDLGPWFEHFLGLKRSDLLSGDYTYLDVAQRIGWIRAQLNRGNDSGGD